MSSFFYKEPKYSSTLNKITKNFSKEARKSNGLILYGFGGEMSDEINIIDLSFSSKKKLSPEQARSLYIETLENYLFKINSNEKIRPYLKKHPFDYKNIKLTISFFDSEGRILSDGHVSTMSIVNNKLYYAAYDPEKNLGNQFYNLLEEPPSEARKIVFEQNENRLDLNADSHVNACSPKNSS